MAVPESLRPPPPRIRRPPPKPRRAWRWFVGALIALLAIGGPPAISLLRDKPGRERRDLLVVEQFVAGIVAGASEAAPGRTGFDVAYGLLSASKREALPFDMFFEDWTRLFDDAGFIVEHARDRDRDGDGDEDGERVSAARRGRAPIAYLLFLGGEQEDHARLRTMRLEVTPRFEASERRWEIADYAVREVPNPRAAR